MLERITPGIDKFYVACGKTDMRMGINGLVNKITTEFKLEPCENSAFLFCGIRKDRIKVLLTRDSDAAFLICLHNDNIIPVVIFVGTRRCYRCL